MIGSGSVIVILKCSFLKLHSLKSKHIHDTFLVLLLFCVVSCSFSKLLCRYLFLAIVWCHFATDELGESI